jgi:hypothetical protein
MTPNSIAKLVGAAPFDLKYRATGLRLLDTHSPSYSLIPWSL